jgi:hypothetical protein
LGVGRSIYLHVNDMTLGGPEESLASLDIP